MTAGQWILLAVAFALAISLAAVKIDDYVTRRANETAAQMAAQVEAEDADRIAEPHTGEMILPQYTRWFEIGVDGQPGLVGWWDVWFHGADSPNPLRRYWTGKRWCLDQSGAATFFGGRKFSRDRYRGLSQDPNAIVNLDRALIDDLRFQLGGGV